ncbi:MAG: flippase-like domain-containing protein [Magnetococcales bacterium]|nr:flippase-like domain-containing protein [Magnetococcales bacterium]
MFYLKLFIASLLVYWLVVTNQLDFSAIGEGLFSFAELQMAAVLLLGFAMQALRWSQILTLHNIIIPFKDVVRIFLIGQFFFMTSLGMAGGEVARGYYIRSYAGDKSVAAISTVLLDRLLGLYTFTFLGSMAFVTIWLQSEPPTGVVHMGMVAIVLCIVLSMFFLLLYQPKLRKIISARLGESWQKKMAGVFSYSDHHMEQLPRLFLVSTLSNIVMITAFKLACEILNAQIGWQGVFLITPLVILANSLPISFGGIGVGEATAQALLLQIGIDNGAVIMLLVRVTQWLTILPLGAYFYMVESKKSP